jgi:hypothetical protein
MQRGLLHAVLLLSLSSTTGLSSLVLSARRAPVLSAPSADGPPCRRAPTAVCVAPPEEPAPQQAEPVTLQERVRLFWRLAVPYFEQAEGAKLNFGLMLLLVLINSSVSVIFSYVGRDFYSALSAKDEALFLAKTANYAVGLAVATPLTVLYKFQRQRLALNWREWMTTELARQYYTDQAFYKLEIDSEIDNPDQRITEDVTAFTKVRRAHRQRGRGGERRCPERQWTKSVEGEWWSMPSTAARLAVSQPACAALRRLAPFGAPDRCR